MPRTKSSDTAIDEIGQPTSKKARELYDEKDGGPTNYATNKKVAQRAAAYVSDYLSRIEMSRTYLVDRMTVFYTLWNGDSVADYFPTSRSVHSPEPFKAVETFVPRAMSLLVGSPGWFRVTGIDDAGRRNAETITKLILAQLRRDKFPSKMRSALRDTGIYGWSPARIRWKLKRRTVKYNELTEQEPESPDDPGRVLSIKRGVETEINEDGPTMENIDPFDFFNDLRFRDHQESPGVVFKQQRFEHELINMRDAGHYKNVDLLLSEDPVDSAEQHALTGPPGTIGNPGTFQDVRNASDGLSLDIGNSRAGTRLYEIYEFWGLWDKDYDPTSHTKGEEKEFCIILGRKAFERSAGSGYVALRITENPYWHGRRPCVVSHYIRRSHAFHSVGVIEPIVKLSAELDDSRNMALAARSLEAAPPIIVGDDADIYTNNYTIEAGSVIRARNADAAKVMFMPKASESAWRAEAAIRADIRETTGMVSTLQGTADSASETATSVVNRTREANKRIDEACKNISEEFLVPMLEQFHALNQQYITKERLMQVVGEDGLTAEFRKVSPTDVAGQVNFEITALPEIEIAGLKARMVDAFMDRAVNIEAIAPGTHRLAELSKMSWIATFGTANIDKVFPNADAPLKYRSAMDEHYLYGAGYSPDVQQGENYLQHYREHTAWITVPTFKKWPPDHQTALFAHIKNTELRLQQEVEQTAPRTPQEMAMQQMGGMGAPGGGGAPQGGGQPQPPGAQPPMGKPRGVGAVTTEGQVRSAAASNSPRTPKGDSGI